MLFRKTMVSPVGALRLIADDEGLVGLYLPNQTNAPEAREVDAHPVLDRAARELEEYFAGARRSFSIPLRARGTDFQRAVWSELMRIPFGERTSYARIARALGKPSAVRAVGAANGKNPISIVVPCHRVVASNGALTGYAGGLEAKAWLLAHEHGA
jgi:methylated-DNA-[protein]-cysteine S-methyltransferase